MSLFHLVILVCIGMIHKDTCIQLLVVMMKAVDVEDLFHITKLDKMALAKLKKSINIEIQFITNCIILPWDQKHGRNGQDKPKTQALIHNKWLLAPRIFELITIYLKKRFNIYLMFPIILETNIPAAIMIGHLQPPSSFDWGEDHLAIQ